MQVKIKQNTPEWHEWRKSCDFTASEAPALFGESQFYPHTTAELKAVKLGLLPPPFYSKAMQDGHNYEARARELAEESLGEAIIPACFEREFEGLKLGASLDGVADPFDPVNIEIKVSAKSMDELDKQYHLQLQFQMFVSGCRTSRLVAYRKETDTVEISDPFHAAKSFADALKTWIGYYSEVEPAEPKIKEVDDPVVTRLAELYREIDEKIKKLKAEQDEIKAGLIAAADGKSIKCAGVTVYPIKPRESVDWKKLAADNGITPAPQYIKKGSPSWGVRIVK